MEELKPGYRWRLVHCVDAPERHGMEITLGERLELEWHRNSKKDRKRFGEEFRRMWDIADQPGYYIAEDDLIKMWEPVN